MLLLQIVLTVSIYILVFVFERGVIEPSVSPNVKEVLKSKKTIKWTVITCFLVIGGVAFLEATSSLSITSDPPGAKIYIDGKHEADTTEGFPASIRVPPGEHRVRVLKSIFHEDFNQPVMVWWPKKLPTIQLNKKKSTIYIDIRPMEYYGKVKVRVEGVSDVFREKYKYENVDAGVYKVEGIYQDQPIRSVYVVVLGGERQTFPVILNF